MLSLTHSTPSCSATVSSRCGSARKPSRAPGSDGGATPSASSAVERGAQVQQVVLAAQRQLVAAPACGSPPQRDPARLSRPSRPARRSASVSTSAVGSRRARRSSRAFSTATRTPGSAEQAQLVGAVGLPRSRASRCARGTGSSRPRPPARSRGRRSGSSRARAPSARAGSRSSRSSAGTPMLPASCDGRARPRARGETASAAVVLLPLVPVTPITPAAAALGEPQRRRRRHGHPRRAQRAQLGAVDRHARRAHHHVAAARAPRPTSRPLDDTRASARASVSRTSSLGRRVERGDRDPRRRQATRELVGERARSRARRPTRRRVAPSSSENRTDIRQQRRRHRVLVAEREHRVGVAPVGGELRQHLARRAAARRGARSSAGRAASSRIAARLSCSSPTHSNGLWPPVAVSSAKPSNWRSSSSRSRPKISRRCCGLAERRQRQEHEAALGAVAAPRRSRAAPGRCGRSRCSS